MAIKILVLVFAVLYYANCDSITKECPENQVYSECHTECPKTCSNKDAEGVPCKLSCRAGCGCDSGFVYATEKHEKCIEPKDCEKQTGGIRCPRTEIHSDCNGHCQKSCEGEPEKCTKQCVPGCVCPKGFIRSKRVNGKCIADNACEI